MKQRGVPTIPFNIQEWLVKALRETASRTEGFDSEFEPEVREANPRYGDYQASGVKH